MFLQEESDGQQYRPFGVCRSSSKFAGHLRVL